MVRLTTPPPIDSLALALIDQALAASSQCVAVAYSAGRDSTALLHATLTKAREKGGLQVFALHVHHGLSACADSWLGHAKVQCEHWHREGLPVVLHWQHLKLVPMAGQSIEAVARNARYAALTAMAKSLGCTQVLLAHHQQDQAETFLLQALRGAGVAGLSSMPQQVWRHGIQWMRPWLELPAADVALYIEQNRLSHIQDDSNADVRLARNRLRLLVWPYFLKAFEQADKSLAHAAKHQADVKACLDDWLALKLPSVTQFNDNANSLGLVVKAWRTFNDGQQRELLRAWFALTTGHALPTAWVNRLHREVNGNAAHWPFDGRGAKNQDLRGQLVLYRGVLIWLAVAPANALGKKQVSAPISMNFKHTGVFPVPQMGGSMLLEETQNQGIALHRLQLCELRSRQGGEKFQLAPDRPARCLKKQFQACGVPSALRHQPLLWSGEQLVFVPGLGIDAKAWANHDELQVRLAWLPDQDQIK